MLPKVNEVTASYMQKFSSINMGFFDENGNVELDTVYKMAKDAVQKSGQFTLFGIIFNETDIDKLYTYIKNTQVR